MDKMIQAFKAAQDNLVSKLKQDGHKGIMIYGPFSEEYWKSETKIVICNAINYGYEECDENRLTFDDFKTWKNAKNGRKTVRTVRHSVQFIGCLMKKLEGQNNIGINELLWIKSEYYNASNLDYFKKNVTYMNICPVSDTQFVNKKYSKQDTNKLNSIVMKYKLEIKHFIEALAPDIFIFGAKNTGYLLNNFMFDADKQWKGDSDPVRVGHTLFCYAPLAIFPNYCAYKRHIDRICTEYKNRC